MSSVNHIPASRSVAGTTAAQSGSTSGASAKGMANFWDMIMSQFGEANAAGKAQLVSTGDAAQKQAGDNPLALLQLALANQNIDGNGNIVLDETNAAGKIQRQLDLTNTIINHLKNMLPQNAQNDGVMEGVLAKLQAKSDTLQASLSALNGGKIAMDTPVKDLPLPILIALGLNPAEITKVSEKLQEMQKKLGREITVEDLIAGVGGLIPTQNSAVVAMKTSGATATLDAIDENSQPTDDLAARLNALDVGAGSKDPNAGITNLGTDEEFGKGEGIPLNDTSDKLPKPEMSNNPTRKDVNAFKEHLVNMMGNKGAGDMTIPATSNAMDADSAIMVPCGYQPGPVFSLGKTAEAANMVSSPTYAGQNHPATQMVAATLTKAGKSGEDSTISLRLDPPELGNVSVRLQFGKDKTVKAHVTVEKPETYMMLQREGHSLERALQNAGLDTQGQSISFELAQDNGTGRRDGESSDNRNFGGGGKAGQDAGGADEIIQSSMTWQVDSATGHMRYNIMA